MLRSRADLKRESLKDNERSYGNKDISNYLRDITIAILAYDYVSNLQELDRGIRLTTFSSFSQLIIHALPTYLKQ